MGPILSVTLPFFALVLMGYVAAHKRVLPESAIPGLNAFVLYFALPAMLFRFGMNTPIGQLLNPVVLVVSLLAGYVARATIGPGAEYLHVFQVVGAAAWLAYAWATPSDSIWMGKPWSSTFVYMIDGLIYAALTAGTFASMWPESAMS